MDPNSSILEVIIKFQKNNKGIKSYKNTWWYICWEGKRETLSVYKF